MMSRLSPLEIGELLVLGRFDMDEMIVSLWQCADELVELELGGGLFPALGVLDHENHHQGDGSGTQRKGRCPDVGEAGRTDRHDSDRDRGRDRRRRASLRRQGVDSTKEVTQPSRFAFF